MKNNATSVLNVNKTNKEMTEELKTSNWYFYVDFHTPFWDQNVYVR